MGGICFWVPYDVAFSYLRFFGHRYFVTRFFSMLAWPISPLVGVAALGAISWMAKKQPPRWGSILAGIYIVGLILFCLPIEPFVNLRHWAWDLLKPISPTSILLVLSVRNFSLLPVTMALIAMWLQYSRSNAH